MDIEFLIRSAVFLRHHYIISYTTYNCDIPMRGHPFPLYIYIYEHRLNGYKFTLFNENNFFSPVFSFQQTGSIQQRFVKNITQNIKWVIK